MEIKSYQDIFLNPESVAVVGATERPGAWGSFIMAALLSLNYPGKIYPVNRGRPGMHTAETPDEWKIFLDIEKQRIQGLNDLEEKTGIPVLIGSHYSQGESQAICDLNKQGIRIYNRLYEISQLLSLMYDYWREKPSSGIQNLKM